MSSIATPRTPQTPAAIAAIDIGTNSIHMIVARLAGDGRFETVTRLKEMVRLGSGEGEMTVLADDAIERGIEALKRCAALAQSLHAEIVAVATSAVREALNAEVFIDRARDEAGVEIEVISGQEEGRLIQLGVLQNLPYFDESMFLIDIGGGSTELVISRCGEVSFSRSLKLGALRMTRAFFPDGIVRKSQVKECRSYIRSLLAPIVHAAHDEIVDVVVASSGTAETLACMANIAAGNSEPGSLTGMVLTRDGVNQAVSALVAAETTEERKRIPGVEAARADILLGGALILEAVCESFGVNEMVISEFALREGVLLNAIQRYEAGAVNHLRNLRRRSVFHLVELYDDDPDHAVHVSRLALSLFDQLFEELGVDESTEELLEAAALLANVGLAISHSKHHKHSYYVIRNSDHLMGFTDREIELIAQIARYHRKSLPSVEKHPEYAALSEEDRHIVRALAGILRIAIGMDRNHNQVVRDVRVDSDDNVVGLTLVTQVGAIAEVSTDLEQYSVGERSRLLSDVVQRDVVVRPE